MLDDLAPRQDRPDGRLLEAGDVAVLLGVPKSWVYAETRAGRMPHVALGRYRRYRREAVDSWVADRERGPIDPQRRGEHLARKRLKTPANLGQPPFRQPRHRRHARLPTRRYAHAASGLPGGGERPVVPAEKYQRVDDVGSCLDGDHLRDHDRAITRLVLFGYAALNPRNSLRQPRTGGTLNSCGAGETIADPRGKPPGDLFVMTRHDVDAKRSCRADGWPCGRRPSGAEEQQRRVEQD